MTTSHCCLTICSEQTYLNCSSVPGTAHYVHSQLSQLLCNCIANAGRGPRDQGYLPPPPLHARVARRFCSHRLFAGCTGTGGTIADFILHVMTSIRSSTSGSGLIMRSCFDRWPWIMEIRGDILVNHFTTQIISVHACINTHIAWQGECYMTGTLASLSPSELRPSGSVLYTPYSTDCHDISTLWA